MRLPNTTGPTLGAPHALLASMDLLSPTAHAQRQCKACRHCSSVLSALYLPCLLQPLLSAHSSSRCSLPALDLPALSAPVAHAHDASPSHRDRATTSASRSRARRAGWKGGRGWFRDQQKATIYYGDSNTHSHISCSLERRRRCPIVWPRRASGSTPRL